MPELHQRMRLNVLPGRYAVCRLAADDQFPAWVHGRGLVSITRTHEELSVVCEEDRVPSGVRCERGYSVVGVKGPRSEERRVGKEGRSRWAPYHHKMNKG